MNYSSEAIAAGTNGDKFDTKACEMSVPTPEQFAAQSAEVLKSLGADQKCKTTMDNEYSNHYKNTTESDKAVAVVFPWGGGGAAHDRSETTSDISASDRKTSEGCSNVMMDTTTQMNNTNALSCTLNQHSSESSTSVNTNASIEINSELTPEMADILRTEIITLGKANDNLGVPNPEKADPATMQAFKGDKEGLQLYFANIKDQNDAKFRAYEKLLDSTAEKIKDLQEKISGAGAISITNSTIQNFVGVGGTLSTVNVSKVKNEVKETVKKATKAAAEQHLKQQLGVNTLTPNVKQLISKKVEDNDNKVDKSIDQVDNQVSVEINSDGKIVINSGGATISLDNVVMDNKMEITLKSKQLSQNATSTGKDIGQEIVNDYNSYLGGDQTVAGQADMLDKISDNINAQAKASADNIKEMGDASGKQGKFLSDTMSSITSMLSMAALLPLLMAAAPLLVVFVVPMLGFSIPKPLKYLLIAIAIYLLVAYFMGLPPFSQKSSREINRKNLTKLLGDLDKIIEKFDTDKSGHLSRSEFERAMKKDPKLVYNTFDELQHSYKSRHHHIKGMKGYKK
jgi:hypothetical protein